MTRSDIRDLAVPGLACVEGNRNRADREGSSTGMKARRLALMPSIRAMQLQHGNSWRDPSVTRSETFDGSDK